MKKSPQEGGCWYCHTDEGELRWCKEFDTWVHEDCAREAAKVPGDREAQIIWREVKNP